MLGEPAQKCSQFYKGVIRAGLTQGAVVQHALVKHRCFDVFVAYESWNRADVLTLFQRVGCG